MRFLVETSVRATLLEMWRVEADSPEAARAILEGRTPDIGEVAFEHQAVDDQPKTRKVLSVKPWHTNAELRRARQEH